MTYSDLKRRGTRVAALSATALAVAALAPLGASAYHDTGGIGAGGGPGADAPGHGRAERRTVPGQGGVPGIERTAGGTGSSTATTACWTCGEIWASGTSRRCSSRGNHGRPSAV